jgi:hypothetical protein
MNGSRSTCEFEVADDELAGLSEEQREKVITEASQAFYGNVVDLWWEAIDGEDAE